MSKFSKVLSIITAMSTLGMYAFSVPTSAASQAYSPIAEMGVRIEAESKAGGIVTKGNLGSGIAKGNAEEGRTAVEVIGEGTDGRVSSRYDMNKTPTMELAYGQSKRFALIEQYSVDNLSAAESLTFTYTGAGSSSQKLAVWLYDGEMPTSCTVNTTGAENANTIIQNLAKSYGIYSGNSTSTDATVTTAEAIAPLAVSASAVAENEACTITLTGTALAAVKTAAKYDNAGKGTFVITVNGASLTSDTTAKIYMYGSTEVASSYYPSLTVSYGASEIIDAPESAIVMKDTITNAAGTKKFDVDSDSYITAVNTTNNNDIWYIGDYDVSDITAFTVRAIMCPGYTDTEITTTPALNIAYMDITEGETIDADYIASNSSTIRNASRKLCSHSGYTVEKSDTSDYNDFSDITISNNSEKSGMKHLFVYGTAQKARIYLDYITVSGAKLAQYPAGAKGVYNTGIITNYGGAFKKAFISNDEYRNITDYKNKNDYMWYLGTYNISALESIEISAAMTAAVGEDGKLYNPSVKLAYMPVSDTKVDADYLSENSKTIRSAANTIYEWSEATDGLVVKTVNKSELTAISESRAELFVYGTTQVKYTTEGGQTFNAQPTLGLDYVKITSAQPSALTITASDDMQLRLANTTDYRTTSAMEFKASETARYAFTGAMKFDIADITSYVNSGYKIKSAVLRTTTMKRNNSNELKAVPFTTDFGESYAKNDVLGDELSDTVNYAVENYKSYTIGQLQCAASGKNLNDYLTTDGADTDITKWYNMTDITEYLAGAAVTGARELPILIYNESETDKQGNQLCTKDIANDKNWAAISGFYKIDGNAVTESDFAPALIVEFEQGTETAVPVEVLTSRIYRNRVDLLGGYDYLAWKCSKDITYNGTEIPAGSSIYNLQVALEQNSETSTEDYELTTFYVKGTDSGFANGEANTRTNPYIDSEGTKHSVAVTEFVNAIKLSEDLTEEADKVYLAAYGEDGVLKNVAVYDAAAEISLPLNENGEGFAVAPNDILKVFVWGNNQKPIYIN